MGRNIIECFKDRTTNTSSALALCYAGREHCRPGHCFGPAVRAHYLIHFVIRGRGLFCVKKKEYQLEANQMFIIKPGETTYYMANSEDPWEYMWIAFIGTDVTTILQNCGLMGSSPVMPFVPEVRLIDALQDTITQLQSKSENEYALLGNLYSVFGCLLRNHRESRQQASNLYIRQALNFIHNNYSYNLKIQDIAEYLQIDRTYLYRLFTSEMEVSPKKYLLQYRIKIASELLTNTEMAVQEIAYTCGFSDPSAFSSNFQSLLGFTPKQFRKIDGDGTLSYVNRR